MHSSVATWDPCRLLLSSLAEEGSELPTRLLGTDTLGSEVGSKDPRAEALSKRHKPVLGTSWEVLEDAYPFEEAP